MKTLQRLYLRDFSALLCLLSFGFSAIFSLIDLAGKMDDFMAAKPSAAVLAWYAALTVPRLFLYLLPMSVLISSLYTFSQAQHRKEMIAIRTAGGRLRTFFTPFVIAGVILSAVAFLTSEFVVPACAKRTTAMKNALQGKTKKVVFSEGGLWLKDRDGSPVKIDLYVAEKKLARGISIFVTGDGSLREKIVAEKAEWDGKTWILENITRYDVQTGNFSEQKRMPYPKLESPEFFTKEVRPTDEMGIAELYRYMQRLRNAGFRNVKLAVDINSKISFPLINVFMMLLGISLSLRSGFGGALFSSGLGLLISLLYWFSYTFSLSLGYAGIAPPLAAAWLIPLLFGALAGYLFTKIPE